MGDHQWLNRRDGEVALHADAGTYRTDDGCGGHGAGRAVVWASKSGRRTASRIEKGSIAALPPGRISKPTCAGVVVALPVFPT